VLAIRSIPNVRDKKKLTQELVALLPEEQRISPASAFTAWWYNLRSTGGLRLTTIGYITFVDYLDLAQYEFRIEDAHEFNLRTVIALDRQLELPYYIVIKKGVPLSVIFFGSKEAMLVNLYGDLKQFLDNYNI
jgi:hypothetical protein